MRSLPGWLGLSGACIYHVVGWVLVCGFMVVSATMTCGHGLMMGSPHVSVGFEV
jgi:hypothetical protein